MANLTWANRVVINTTTTGTGTLTLGAALNASQQGTSALVDGATYEFCITDNSTYWEDVQGVYTAAGTTLSRVTVHDSSNAGALVNLPAGTKQVFISVPASVINRLTNYTAGSVLFGSNDGMPTQDNTKFFFDDTGKQLMVGTNNPTVTFTGGAVAGANLVAYRTQSIDGFDQGLLRTYCLFDGSAESLAQNVYIPVGARCDYRSTDLVNPLQQVLTGNLTSVNFGLQGGSPVAAVGTFAAQQTNAVVLNCGNAQCEHATFEGALRYDTNNAGFSCTTPGRGWFADYSMHGAVEQQQGCLSGMTMFMNYHYNGPSADNIGGAFWAATGKGSGGSTEFYHSNARTYQLGTGFGVVGFSTNQKITRGWEIGMQVGGAGSNWGTGLSHVGTGIDLSSFDTAGLHVNRPFSGICGIYLIAGGSGYTTPPTVTISAGGGSGATAAAELVATTVASVSVSVGGSNYTSVPTATIDAPWPSGTTATATAVMGLGQLVLTNGGTGYTPGTGYALGIAGGGGASATGTFDVSAGGVVQNLVITAAGTGYTSQPTISFPGAGAGVNAAATAYLKVVSVTVNTAGTGYKLRPAVTFSGGGGGGVTATTTLTAAAIDYIRITNPGVNFTSTPTVAITGGGGSNAVAVATVCAMGVMGDCYILDGGSGYSQLTQPTITITGGQGSGATIDITAVAGAITAVVVNAAGTLYPVSTTVYLNITGGGGTGGIVSVATNSSGGITGTVTILAAGSGYTTTAGCATTNYLAASLKAIVNNTNSITALMVIDGGAAYSSAPTVTIGAPSQPTATGTAVLTADTVTSITITVSGLGYASVPAITVNNAGTGGTGLIATAVLRFGRVVRATINSGGKGYVTPPTVTFAAPAAGSTATVNTVTLMGTNAGILVNADTTATGYGQPKAIELQTNNASNWCVDTTGRMGMSTGAPTHPLTFSSTAAVSNVSQAFYNTADQTTDFERMEMGWGITGTAFCMRFNKGGAGSNRQFNVLLGSSTNIAIAVLSAINQGVNLSTAGTTTANSLGRVLVGGSTTNTTATSGTSIGLSVIENFKPTSSSTMLARPLSVTPTINYSNATPGAGSYEAINVSVTETSLPTGQNYLCRMTAGLTAAEDQFVIQNNSFVGIGISLPTSGLHQLGSGYRLAALATPGAPTTATGGGTPAGASDRYFVVAEDHAGNKTLTSAASSATTRGSSAANWVKITWSAVAGSVKYYVLVNTTTTPANTTLMTLTGTWSSGVITGISSLVGGTGGANGTFTDGTFTAAANDRGTGGTFAYTISGGIVTNICILNTGSNYAAQPTFTMPSKGSLTGFSATANIAATSTAGGTNLEADDSGQAINGAFTVPARNATADSTVDGDVISNAVPCKLVGCAFTQTADATANTKNQTITLVGTGVGTMTLPANFMIAGRTVRLRAMGTMTSTSGGATLTFFVKVGSVTVCTSLAVGPSTSVTTLFWEMDCSITCRTTGSGGTVQAGGQVIFYNSATVINTWAMPNTTTAAMDTTASQLVDFQVTQSNATAQVIVTKVLTMEIVAPNGG